MSEMTYRIVEAYLCHCWSQRRIQSEIMNIPALERGGGYEAMEVLHSFGITGRYKGILRGEAFNRELFRQTRSIRKYLAAINAQ